MTDQKSRAGTSAGHAALTPLGAPSQALKAGHPLDLVILDARSARTIGADPHELVLVAAADDVRGTVVRGTYRESVNLRARAVAAYLAREALHV